MLPPFVVEEYNGKFWVHKQGHYDMEQRKHIKGELAYDKGFDSYDEAQTKASKLITKTGKLW